jgi:hypothetical protein
VAQAQGTDSSSKRKSTGSPDTLPEVMQSGLVSQLKGDIARLESRLKEVSGNLGVNHPQYLRSQAELAELKSKMNAEIGRIASSINTAGNISKQKQSELIAAVNAQKREFWNYANNVTTSPCSLAKSKPPSAPSRQLASGRPRAVLNRKVFRPMWPYSTRPVSRSNPPGRECCSISLSPFSSARCLVWEQP